MTIFTDYSTRMIHDLGVDFGLTSIQAAGVCGNMGEESNGLTQLQEVAPLSGVGGLGGLQWTGPRRTQFEAWCKAHNVYISTYDATYGFLHEELSTTQASALAALRKATTVYGATEAFMNTFERPNAKYAHLDVRYQWAQKALAAYKAASAPGAVQVPASAAVTAVVAVAAAPVAVHAGLPLWVAIPFGVVILVALIASVVKGK